MILSPPFQYDFGAGVLSYPGRNWGTGESIFAADCSVPPPAPATLTVTKSVAGVGATALPNDFNLMVGTIAVLSGAATTFTPGTYTVSETNLPNYTPGAWGGDCLANGSITLLAGDNKTCTITNTYVAPQLLCTDPLATNVGQPLPCVYTPPPTLCADPLATNIGMPLPCVYTPPPTTCTVVITSDTADYVVEKTANAQVLSFIHSAWTASLGSASWIWGDNPVVDPTVSETQTFRKQFGFVGTVSSATLEVASDNTHTATLNTGAANPGGSTFNAPVSYNVTADVAQGNNTLTIGVTNTGVPASLATSNPAGLKYRLTIQGTPTTDADCAVPYVPPVVINGCTNPDATNYNAQATVGNPQAANCDFNYPSQCGENPNLLKNGSFEEPVIAGPWSPSALTDWVVTKVGDSSPTLAEIWRGLSPSSNLAQHLELDGTEPAKITQTVATIPGATYQLRFDFAARSDASSEADNSVLATADTTVITNTATDNTNWTTYGGTFISDNISTEIALADMGTPNTFGTLVDNAVLCLVRLPDGGGDDEDTYRVQGYVWHDDNENQEWDEEFIIEQETTELLEDPLAGWTVNITDGETTFSTTTDSEGYYYFEVPAGTWTITEVVQDGWGRTTQESHVVTVPIAPVVTLLDSIVDFVIPTAHAAVLDSYGDYNFGNNEVRRSSSGGGGGTRVDNDPDGEVLGDSDSPKPLVLGEQTSVVPTGAPNTGKGGTAMTIIGQFLATPRRRNHA